MTASVGVLKAPKFHSLGSRVRIYRSLAKSGIVALVGVSVLAGYLVGHPLELPFDTARFGQTLLGILLLASGSAALNQLQEIALDARMPRTARRPLPSGEISRTEAIAFTSVTLAGGAGLLFALDTQVGWLGLLAVASYNGLYTLWWKRRWAFAAVPGALPGALPIFMAHVAASGDLLAPGGWYLFLILFFWQMPHFWVLALRYRADYEAAAVPTLPVALGAGVAVMHTVLWCLAYVALALVAPLFLPVGSLYLVAALATSGVLLALLRAFARSPESRHWLTFFLGVNFSLIAFLAAIAADLWSVYLIPWATR